MALLFHSRPLCILRHNRRDDNLGDQFIFRALATELSRRGSIIMRDAPPQFVAHLPWMQRQHGFVASLLKHRLRGGRVFDFASVGAVLWEPPKDRPDVRPYRRLRKVLVQLTSPIPVAVGRSVIPGSDHSWCSSFKWIGVRDDESLNSLKSAGLGQAFYFPDLAFLQPAGSASPPRIISVALSFRRSIPENRFAEPYARKVKEALADFLQGLPPGERQTATGFHQVEQDAEYMMEISREMAISLRPERLTIENESDFYARVQMVISNRLHCLLLGALGGSLPVALTDTSHSKLVSLYQTIGWERLVVLTDDPGSIPKQLAEIQAHRSSLQAMVVETCRRQRDLAQSQLDERLR